MKKRGSFTASPAWLWKFKRHYRIVSRKITRFVTSLYLREKFDIIGFAGFFVDSSKIFMQNYPDENIYNTDQSDFNREIHSGRTLEFRESTQVERVAQSISATTHSYTIQPTISKDGKLLSLLFIVL
jgi:hypothetical protein